MTTTARKAETTIDPIEAARQISDKAQSELDSLQGQLPALQQKVVDLQTEEETLTQNIEGRKTRRAGLKQVLQTAQTAHTDAVAYASVATDTVGEMDAIKTAVERKKELDATAQLHEQTVQEHTAADEQDLARLTVIRSEHEKTMTTLHDLHARINAVEGVKQRSLSELGEGLHASLVKEHQAYRARVEETKAAFVAAQMDEHTFLAQSAEQLKTWPEHRTFKDALGVDGPLIRILQAELAYIDQLITDAGAVARLSNSGGRFLPSGIDAWRWRDIFQFSWHDLEYAGFGSDLTVEGIKKRRQSVATFLEGCTQMAKTA